MDADGFAAIAAWAAVPAAYVSARYGRSQARSAEKSSIADSRSSYATLDQARVSRTADHRAEKPVFAISIAARDGHYPVTVRMVDGPTQIEVVAAWIVEVTGPEEDAGNGTRVSESRMDTGTGQGRYELVKNDRFELRVTSPLDDAARVEVKVVLQCASLDDRERREWPHVEIVEWIASPKSRVRWLG
jgi:hypothetical protein